MTKTIVRIFILLNIIAFSYANEASSNIVSNKWNNIVFIYRKYEPIRFKNGHITIETICKTNQASNAIRTKYYSQDNKTITIVVEDETGKVVKNIGHKKIDISDIGNHRKATQLFFYGENTSYIHGLEYNKLLKVKKDGIYRLRIQCYLYEDDGGKELKEIAVPEVVFSTKIYTTE